MQGDFCLSACEIDPSLSSGSSPIVVGRDRFEVRLSCSRSSKHGSGTAAEDVDDGRVEDRLVPTDEQVEDRHPDDVL